jgi:adenosylcobyric acid synthase
MQLLKTIHRDLVQGFLINKFRGDQSLLTPAIKSVENITKKKILGVIPKVDFSLPAEDSLDGGDTPNTPKMTIESCNSQIDLIAKAIRDNVNIEKIMLQVIR